MGKVMMLDKVGYGTQEAFNTLKVNLSFSGRDIRSILFTSGQENEGKSSTVTLLGQCYAKEGKRVLIIDADLRKSVLAGRYEVITEGEEIIGLSHYLSGQAELEEVLFETDLDHLHIILAGRTSPNPTELLGNELFDQLLTYGREHYDLVLIDSPPLGLLIDAAVIAPKCDGTVLVIESGRCRYSFLQEVKKQLEAAGAKILGAVLNKAPITKGSYGGKHYVQYYKE